MYSPGILIAILSGVTIATPSIPINDSTVAQPVIVAASTHEPSLALAPRDTGCTAGYFYEVSEPRKRYQIQCDSYPSVAAFDHKEFDAGSWQNCIPACNSIKGRSGWTWTPAASDGGFCWLKKGKNVWPFPSTSGYVAGRLEAPFHDDKNGGQPNYGAQDNGACRSGKLLSAKNRHYNIKCYSDTTIPQHGLTYFYVGTWRDCISVCDGNAGCSAFTWQPKGAGGTCWFKYSKGSHFYDAALGYVAAIVSGPS